MAFDKTQPYATVNTDAGNIYYLQGGTFYNWYDLSVAASPPAPVDTAPNNGVPKFTTDANGVASIVGPNGSIIPVWWQRIPYAELVLGDSLEAANAAMPHTPANRATIIITLPSSGAAGVNANGLFVAAADAAPLCVRGNGTLKYYSASNALSWTALGDTEGAQVPITTAATLYTLSSGTAGSELYVQCISRLHPTLGDTSNTINVTGSYRLRNGSNIRTWLGTKNLLMGSGQAQINYSIPTLKASDVWASRAEWSATYAVRTIVALGTNDVVDAASALQAVTDVSNICKLASSKGSEVCIALLMPYDTSTSTQHAAVAQFNRLIREFAKTINAIVIDLFTAVCTYQGPSATVTISNASPGVVTWTGNTFTETQPITFTTTGTLPAPLQPSTVYYVKGAAGVDTFNLSSTPRGAAINTTNAGSGVHTGISPPGNGVFDTGNTIDGLHLAGQGSYKAVKRVVIPALGKSMNSAEPLVPGHVVYNSSTAVYGNLLVNSQMNGSVAAANAGMSGFLPTSWTAAREVGSNITAVWSVPDTTAATPPNGLPGRLVTGSISNSAGADGEAIRFRPSAFITTGFVAGEYVMLEGFITLRGTKAQWVEVSCFTQGAAGSSQARNSLCPFADTSNVAAIGNLDNDVVVIPIKTKPLLIESDATSVMMYIIVGMLAGGEGDIGISDSFMLHKVAGP